ncbi:hypothetical protein ACFPVS_02755 [Neisseria weixii]|uniref:hypothetical protein n=1 Tax=Neisseria weixii TaxID=1853276 RepID=UPI0012FD86DF|nr:hypothetical protein [Neisseria weixii]
MDELEGGGLMDSLTVFLLIVLALVWTFFFIARHSVNKLKKEHEEKMKAGKNRI